MSDIRRAIREITKNGYETFPADVTAVHADSVHADSVDVMPIGSEAQIYGVRLKAALDGSGEGVLIVPKVQSTVLVTRIGGDDSECFVSMVSDAQEIRVRIGDISFFLDERGLVINEGKLGGLINIAELKSELKKITDYLTAIRQVFSSAWVPVPSDGGAALKVAMNASLATRTLPDFGRIEDEKVKH